MPCQMGIHIIGKVGHLGEPENFEAYKYKYSI